jgi:glucose-6-phosphate 1-dehydrogenase
MDGLTIIVIGASGDLAKKKTYPSLFALYSLGLLPHDITIWGYARSDLTHNSLRQTLQKYILQNSKVHDQKKLDLFLSRCFYQKGKSYNDEVSWRSLSQLIQDVEGTPQQIQFRGASSSMVSSSLSRQQNRLFYMAIPPNLFAMTAFSIQRYMIPNNGWSRLVIEKPFGRDVQSCQILLDTLATHFAEDNIYRIDHYLGKDMAQNILLWRFGNTLFEPTWNRNWIQSVHITFQEPFGTEGRGGYFDSYGIIRDVMQNHLLQILTLIAMENPFSEHSNDCIRDAKCKVLQSIPGVVEKDCLLGQYEGYSDDPTIQHKESTCPTYAAIRCWVHTPRWEGVPFILEAGKALDQHLCEVRVQYKPPNTSPHRFSSFPGNVVVFRLSPNPSITIQTNMKSPGFGMERQSANLSLMYSTPPNTPDAYTKLLWDVLQGNKSHFVREDELRQSWEIFTPLLTSMEHKDHVPIHTYPYGSTGPREREQFLQRMKTTPKIRQSAL